MTKRGTGPHPIRMKPTFEDVALQVLREADRPMHYRDILTEVLTRRPLGGESPEKTANSVLFRSKRMERV